MKKVLSAILVLVLALSMVACGGGKSNTNEIPDVFGVSYTDAISILEAGGFEVSAVETSVGSFSDKLLYPLEKVDKGTVFKIDEYIIDNNGNLNKNYDVFYDEGLVSADKSVVIYYAKEDYVLVKEDTSKETTPSTQPATEPSTEATTSAATEDKKDDNAIDPEFKAAMDSYEEFFDEYVAFMKKYKANPTDLSLLTDYANYMSQYADMMQKFEKWENEDLNTAEAAYYVDVQARITKKLLEVA